MTRHVRHVFGPLGLCIALAACDDTAQPRPPQPDAAFQQSGTGGGAGVGGGASGTGGCSVSPPPLSPASLPAAVLGVAYAQELSIVGATAPQVIWMTGALPGGLTLIEDERELSGPPPEAHARLSGTPSAAGSFRFTVSVSLLTQPPCAAPSAQRDYELLVSVDPDADAGTP
jgi:hypothetical protein